MRHLTPIRIAVAVFLLAGVSAASYLLLRPVTPAQAGTAPDFRLTSTAGGQVALSSYRGRPVLLNFFATWCTTCRAELPVIARARLKYPNLVTLLVDERESASQVRSYLSGLHVDEPALLDTDGAVAERFAIFAQPETVWIAPSGRIRAVSYGPVDAWVVDTRYRQLDSKT